MAKVSKTLIGDAYQSDVSWGVLRSLTAIGNRMAGQNGEAEGAATLREWFEEFGFRNVTTSTFEVPGWWRGSSELTVSGNDDTEYDGEHELIALPGSPAERVTGEIVDVGTGVPEAFESTDVDGKVVLVSSENPEGYDRWVHRGEKYNLAADNGAVGFLFQNEIPGCLPLTGWIGDDGPGAIPAVGLSRETGARIEAQCDETTPTATLNVDAHNEPSTSHTVEGVVGPDTTDEVLLTAHVDAHDISDGATDNAVGCSLVTEVGRLLEEYADLDTAVRVVAFGAEEIGLRGARNWIARNDLSSVKGIVNVDGNGLWDDVTVYTHGFETLTDTFVQIGNSLHPSMNVDDGYLPHSDHWPFVQKGVPGAMIRSESSTGRGWGHTHGDTIDKLDSQPLRVLSIALAEAVVRLADEDSTTTGHSPDAVRQALIDDGHAPGLKVSGDWPFET